VRHISPGYIREHGIAFREMARALPAESFDAALPSYTHRNPLMSWLFWKRLDAAMGLAGDVSGKSVLDFGCGSGVVFKYLSEHGARVAGCDSQTAELARRMAGRLKVEAEVFDDMEKIAPRKFDLILALDVLEHIEDLGPVLKGLAGLSHEKTALIVSGPTESALYRLGRRLAGFTGHYHVRSVYGVERELKGSGFEMTALRRLYFPLVLFRVSSWRRSPAG